jgi:hypothetical protein
MTIQNDYYWQSAQKLAVVLGKCLSIGPDSIDELKRIPPTSMKTALSEMCSTLTFMEMDSVLYKRIAESKANGPNEVRSYLRQTGMNIDELFERFVQFEEGVIRDARINYDFGRIMMSAVKSKQKYLRAALLTGEDIDVPKIKQNVSDVKRWVCRVSHEYAQDDGTIGAFVWGRLLTIAGVKIAANNLVLGGVLIPTGHLDISLSVAAYMSEMAGGLLMMLPSRKED